MRHFIDQACLDAAIAQQLQAAPAVLQPHVPALQRILQRDLPSLALGDRVQPSVDDPLWARRRAAQRLPVHRLGAHGVITARQMVCDLVFTLERMALATRRKDHPMYLEIVKKLRGIPHWKINDMADSYGQPLTLSRAYGLSDLCDGVRGADACAAAEAEPPTPPVRAGQVIGTLHRRREDIRVLGHEAQNCLSSDWRLKDVFLTGEHIWALRVGGKLIAVLSVDSDGVITEVKGPHNSKLSGAFIVEFAGFVAAAALRVDGDIQVTLADLVPEVCIDEGRCELVLRVA